MDRVPLLTGTEGHRHGERFTITAEGLVLGRDSHCAVQLDDPNVSREHARVFLHNAGVWVQDAGSRNGVFVNGKRIQRPKSVSPGDTIRIGEHGFTIELAEPGQEPADLPPPPAQPAHSGATIEAQAVSPPTPASSRSPAMWVGVGALLGALALVAWALFS